MANTTNFGWETPDDTDLVKDGAAAIRTLAGAIDTSLVDLKGGTTGQVLAKNSNTDMDFIWSADASGIPATIFDAKGDLIVASAADTAARLASSANNGDILTVDTSTATGLKWAAPAGGGKVLQVVSATTTTTATSASAANFSDTNLTASITPSLTSSKIMVIISQQFRMAGNDYVEFQLLRGATVIFGPNTYGGVINGVTGNVLDFQIPITYLDSPSTTSSTTYKTQFKNPNSTANAQQNNKISSIILLEIGA